MPKIQSGKQASESDVDLQELLKSRFTAPDISQEYERNSEPQPAKESPSLSTAEADKLEDRTTVLIEVPLSAEIIHHEFTVHVDFKLTPPQSTSVRRLVAELDRRQEKLKNGTRVVNINSAVKWLIEQLEK